MEGNQCSLHTNQETRRVVVKSALGRRESLTNVVEKMTCFVILGSFGLRSDQDHGLLDLARRVLSALGTFARGERKPQGGATP